MINKLELVVLVVLIFVINILSIFAKEINIGPIFILDVGVVVFLIIIFKKGKR